MNVLSSNTTGKWSRIDLIVSSFNIFSVFCEEGEGNFSPRGIFPLGSNDERNNSMTIRSDWFNREKFVRTVLTLKIVNSWNYLYCYIWRCQVCFGILAPKCGYNKVYQRLKLSLGLLRVILWDDLNYYDFLPCWINPL